jgi:hyperosmotically inducible protein
MMKYLFSLIALSALFASAPTSAIDLNPLSAIKSAVEAAIEDRSSGDIATDLKIKTLITKNVISELGTDVISISADVYEQDVLLTGSVEKRELKTKAEQLTRTVDGVKRVFNEIRVVKPVDKDKGAVEGFVDDTVIESKINALLIDAQGVSVTNFRWRSVGGHVFLFGRALSRAEHKKATAVVRDIKNVVKVKNLAKVRAK